MRLSTITTLASDFTKNHCLKRMKAEITDNRVCFSTVTSHSVFTWNQYLTASHIWNEFRSDVICVYNFTHSTMVHTTIVIYYYLFAYYQKIFTCLIVNNLNRWLQFEFFPTYINSENTIMTNACHYLQENHRFSSVK